MNLRPNAHVHLIGICGTAMASLAGILKDMGYNVTGSDQNVYPPMSTQLEKLGIEIMQGYKPQNLMPKPDLVIVGNVISRTNIEADTLLQTDIPYTSLPKAMGEFVIAQRKSIVVAGTHGKTTTTSLMSWLAQSCDQNPGFLIGGIAKNFGKSFEVPKGDLFVIEGDEYDTAFFDKVPKFVHYKARYVILTSIEFDHADIYKDLDHVKSAFTKLMQLIPQDGILIANGDEANVREVIKGTSCANVLTYGFHDVTYKIQNVKTVAQGTQFQILTKEQGALDFEIPLNGNHNVLNATATIVLGLRLGWSLEKIRAGLKSFQGVARRQEVIGEPRGIPVIEDFAHHPTAVKVTIEAIKMKYPQKRLIAVFEPRSATSRRKVFQKDYAEAFKQADLAIIAEPFDQSKIAEEERFSTDQLISDMVAFGTKAEKQAGPEQIVERLKTEARPGDVILIMSNGGFGGLYPQLLKALSEQG